MADQHPITPPPELVAQWFFSAKAMPVDQWVTDVATQAARWGADQELEECRLWVSEESIYAARDLVEARRPKPPSLKEQALQALEAADGADHPVVATVLTADQHALIRRALESLPH
jgi:hypothetical protein